MDEARVRIYLDDAIEPIADYEPPVRVSLDTHELADGEHRLRIEARDRSGRLGVRHVPFSVRNGPGITLSGLQADSLVRGVLDFTVNAFGAEEPFEPRRAESPSPIPVWLWVLSLVIVAWAAWYVAVLWKPPPEFARTPTYAEQSALGH
ncbi:MAG: cytochrome C [Proteobacteria bacterium]|jgi:hypothetical protein|nr:cytochrome C [Pseudomonadota bacterium]